ncbi:MAG: class I SAM-dependent methyltransferase [Candidatus Thorarchaeota archaeon]|nr:class I SAM-dependent methyltransferase [Candidatus Thorarchaeota archaeon]
MSIGHCAKLTALYAVMRYEDWVLIEMDEMTLEPRTWGSCWDHFGARLVDLVEPSVGSLVLDIGTGGGASLYPAAKRVGPKGHVTGIETCESCFNRTSGEIERCRIHNAEIKFMDACEMSFEDESFDFAISGFIGWDNYFDFEEDKHIAEDAIMSEVFRVLKKGGIVGFSGWAKADASVIMRKLLLTYLPSDSFHISNVKAWSHTETKRGWEKILSKAGFVNIKTWVEEYDMVYSSKDEWWQEVVDLDWQEVMEYLEHNAIVSVAELKKQAFFLLNDYEKPDGVHQARNAVLAIGTKP